MTTVLTLLLISAVLGAWDTLWFHEYRAALPRNIANTRTELKLHAIRDSLYVVIYGVLAWWVPSGPAVWVLGALMSAEIVITLADFVVEDRDRPAIGGMAPTERVLHTLMAIVYGLVLAQLVPLLIDARIDDAFLIRHDAPVWMSIAATITAIGIAGTGIRDALAVRGVGLTFPLRAAGRTTPPQQIDQQFDPLAWQVPN